MRTADGWNPSAVFVCARAGSSRPAGMPLRASGFACGAFRAAGQGSGLLVVACAAKRASKRTVKCVSLCAQRGIIWFGRGGLQSSWIQPVCCAVPTTARGRRVFYQGASPLHDFHGQVGLWLAANCKNFRCPGCGAGFLSQSVGREIVAVPLVSHAPRQYVNSPCVQLVCGQCGHLALFSLTVMGIGPPNV